MKKLVFISSLILKQLDPTKSFQDDYPPVCPDAKKFNLNFGDPEGNWNGLGYDQSKLELEYATTCADINGLISGLYTAVEEIKQGDCGGTTINQTMPDSVVTYFEDIPVLSAANRCYSVAGATTSKNNTFIICTKNKFSQITENFIQDSNVSICISPLAWIVIGAVAGGLTLACGAYGAAKFFSSCRKKSNHLRVDKSYQSLDTSSERLSIN